ncbi:hypothetical protein IQ257_19240 [Coleofasciculus sp. LEGE 07092]|nr:hypothetical protein [Coleofasciculus sp. LEGE 07081]MBE9150592.1 hypothetical protein [Coleofasciculus sp. LEGE 07092]
MLPLPWCIIRPLPNLQTAIILRCRRRSDAEAYLRIFRANNPTNGYQIMFDITPEPIPNTI